MILDEIDKKIDAKRKELKELTDKRSDIYFGKQKAVIKNLTQYVMETWGVNPDYDKSMAEHLFFLAERIILTV